MADELISNFKIDLQNLMSSVEGIDPTGDIYEVGDRIKKVEDFIKNMKINLDEIEQELEGESSSKKPLNFNSMKTDFNLAQKKLNTKKDQWQQKQRKEKLLSGQLKGFEAQKETKQMLMDQHKEVDKQGQMIDSIAENVKGANKNLENINAELDNQGQQINRIQEKTLETEVQVKQSDKIITGMTRRAKCMKCIMCLAIIVFGIFDAFWVVFLLAGKFKSSSGSSEEGEKTL